jgi:apolipoprotein N-acyltransferase
MLRIPDEPRGFCVLICFEDSLPYLARRAARAGAAWLVNQTNDSWFDPDCGSVQHLANSVFRSVETRLPMLRCANTGITCAIDRSGRITQTLALRTEGFQVAEVVPNGTDQDLTFYVRHGDLFAQACLFGSIALFIALFFKRKRQTNA